MHGGIEEEHSVIACPHHTPREKRDAVMLLFTRTHTHSHRNTTQQPVSGILTKWLRNPDEEKHPHQDQKWPRERGFRVTHDS